MSHRLHEYSVLLIRTDPKAGPLATVRIQVQAPNYERKGTRLDLFANPIRELAAT